MDEKSEIFTREKVIRLNLGRKYISSFHWDWENGVFMWRYLSEVTCRLS